MARLVWFRSSLRVTDNLSLNAACAHYDGPVYGVFFLTPGQWNAHDLGAPKISFLLRSLLALQRNLEKLGIPLIVLEEPLYQGISRRIVKLCAELNVEDIYADREFEVNELERDRLVETSLNEKGIGFHLFCDQTILPPDDEALKTSEGNPYTVFTPFKKKFLSILQERGTPKPARKPKPRALPPLPPELSSSEEWTSSLSIPLDLFSEHFPGGERDGAERLKRFCAGGLERYHENRDFPGLVGGTSTLSPYLSVGAISPRLCLVRALEAYGTALSMERNGPMVWVSELLWREFYRHVVLHHPRVCKHKAFREKVDAIAWRYDQEDFQRWCDGKTGYPIVDAAMRQLNSTGWMHNRLRMVVAMFLTKHLLIDWRWGERYFNERLVDADFASNNGGWQWSSSTGTDAQPYFRIFNPYSQSERFDAKGSFIRTFCPELASLQGKDIHRPSPLQCSTVGYPLPMIDHEEGRNRALEIFSAHYPV